MMRPVLHSRRLFFAAFALALAPLALLFIPGNRPRDLLLRQYRDRLAGTTPTEKRVLLREAARLGGDGLPLLVETLCADDAVLRDAAYAVLGEQMDQWLRQEPSDAGPALARLAQLLASRSGNASEQTRRQAALLAGRMLLAPAAKTRHNSDLVFHCEAILRSSTAAAVGQHYGISAAPSEAFVSTSTVSAAVPAERVEPIESGPRRVNATEGVPALGPATIVPPAEAIIYTVDPPETLLRQGPAAPPENEAGMSASSAPESAAASESRLAELPDREVMSRLLDEGNAAKATDELRRRGYQPLHLELARRLADPDPTVRMTLLEDLPRLKSVDPRPWLIWLTRDSDRGVRRTAVAIIAVSRDPELRRQLETVRSEEIDPEILHFVCRVLEEPQTY